MYALSDTWAHLRRVWTIGSRGSAALAGHLNDDFVPVGYWGDGYHLIMATHGTALKRFFPDFRQTLTLTLVLTGTLILRRTGEQ